MLRCALPLLALAAAAPAMAAPAGEGGADVPRRVCRPAAPQLGSRIKRPKVCRSSAEWEEMDRARRAATITVKAPQPEPWERTRPQ
ncbi:MAG: hypothetical protein QOG72_174 [Sphingomonadales bacterium]|jgi:hypothetical protein|nr:hypothetical protein [Sphingomonadales bacterium]